MSKKIHGLSKRNWKCFFVGFILAWILAGGCCAAFAGVPVKFTVETSRADVQEVQCYHGETLDFDVTFKNYGKDLYFPTNAEAQIFWQTNGMSAFYWRTNNVNVVSNHMMATFLPEMDPGAGTVFGFIGIPGDIYRASFVLRLKQSPGWKVKEMEWPYRELDFSKVEMKNVPFYFKAEQDETDNEIRQRLDRKIDGIESGKWAYIWVKDGIYWYWHYEDSWYVKTDDPYDWDVFNPGTNLEITILDIETDHENQKKLVTYRQGLTTQTVELPMSEAKKIPQVANAARLNGIKPGEFVCRMMINGRVHSASGNLIEWDEEDPNVPSWAKQPKMPLAEEIRKGTNAITATGMKICEGEIYGPGIGYWLGVEHGLTNYLEWAEGEDAWRRSGSQYPQIKFNGAEIRFYKSAQYWHQFRVNPWEGWHSFTGWEVCYVKGRSVVTNELLTAEKDPTVPEWAKQPEPPEAMPGNGVVLTNGTVKTKSGTTILPGQVGAYSKEETDQRIAGATPGNYNTVSNNAMRAVKPEDMTMDNPSFSNAVTAAVNEALRGKIQIKYDQTTGDFYVETED